MRWIFAIAVASILLLGGLTRPAMAAQDRFFMTSDHVRLHYLEAGRGRTVVFIPGWTMPAWIFNQQIADFSRHYHVVAFDPRGQGDSAAAPDGYEPARRGQDIAELLAQIGPQPVVVVGWSLGVLDTLAFLHSHSDSQIAGLVLVDNSVGEEPPPEPAPSAPYHRGPKPSRATTMRLFVNSMFHRAQPASYLAQLTATALRTPPDAARELLSYPVPRSYWKEAVYSTNKPVLYIVRPSLSGQAANLMAHRPGTESVVLQGVGHALFVDDPARFDALVQGFLHRIWP